MQSKSESLSRFFLIGSPSGASRDGWRRLGWIGVVVILMVGCHFGWRHDGNLGPVDWLPRRISHWVDAHGVIRNFPAFLLLSLPVLALLSAGRARSLAAWSLALFAQLVEYPQLVMPSRVFDWRDIACSLAGVGCAWMAVALVTHLRDTARPALVDPQTGPLLLRSAAS